MCNTDISGGGMKDTYDNLHEQFEFRNIRPEETKQAIAIEQACFPPNEACSPQHMRERVSAAPGLFLVAADRKTGKIVGMLNGLSTNDEEFKDEFFTDITLYRPEGKIIMLLGLAVLPEYQGRGIARELVKEYALRAGRDGFKKMILTCLDFRVPMYEKFGFSDDGLSASEWGGEQWHAMTYVL